MVTAARRFPARARFGRAPVVAGAAAQLLLELDALDHHALVHRLHHVVDGEGGAGHGGERLHLHAGLARRAHARGDGDPGGGVRECHLDAAEQERVAQRNQFRRALRRHDAGQTRRLQRIALLDASGSNGRARFRRHRHVARGHGFAQGDGLVADVHHLDAAVRVHVRQACGSGHAPSLCGSVELSWSCRPEPGRTRGFRATR